MRRVVFVKGDRITSQVVLQTRVYMLFSLLFLIIFGWLALTTFYVFFKDDLLQAAVNERRTLVDRYEAELDLLRDQMNASHAQHKADFSNYARIMDSLVNKQSVLSARHDAITKLVGEAGMSPEELNAAISSKTRPAPNPATYGRPRVEGTGGPFISFNKASNKQKSTVQLALNNTQTALKRNNMIGAFDEFRFALQQTEEQQFEALDLLQNITLDQAETYLDVFDAVRLKAPANATRLLTNLRTSTYEATSSDPTAFQRRLQDVYQSKDALTNLQEAIVYVPTAEPMKNGRITSNFGRRNDPFLRRLAFHSGIDYGAGTGTPILATANGTVKTADWKGGYGKAVEIDHGNGVMTRFGHMSAFNVVEGQKVRKGQVIGYVGSTGRSTGPHLHYETNVHNDAVDPKRFLKAAHMLSEPMFTSSIK